VALDPRYEKVGVHLLVNTGQKDDVLRRILEHLLAQGALGVPEGVIEFHLFRDVIFISILHVSTQILLEEQVQTDLVLIVAIAQVLRRRRDHSVGYLRVKHTITIDTMLIDEGGAVFAEVMEDLDNMATRQNLLQIAAKTVIKGVHSHHVEDVAVVFEAQLNQCDGLSLNKALAVESEDGRRVTSQDLAAEAFNALRRLHQSVILLPAEMDDRRWSNRRLQDRWRS